MTEETYESLIQFEQQFNWAIRSNFCRMTADEFNTVADAYNKKWGKGPTRGEMTCNTCRLRIMKEIGADYFKAKDFYEEKKKKEKEQEQENGQEPKTENKNKKAGRPRKIKMED